MKNRVFIILSILFFALTLKTEVNASTNGEWDYTVSDGVVTINRYLGNNKNVIIPDYINGRLVVKIGEDAFYNMAIESITIPKKIEKVEDRAFKNCYYLKNIYWNAINADVAYHRYTIGTMNSAHIFTNAGKYSDSLKVVFGNGVKRIPTSIFEASSENYAHITSVTVSDSVETIDNWAFSNCIDLKSITLGKNLESLGSGVFDNCLGLKNVVIPSKVKNIDYKCFYYADKLQTIKFNSDKIEFGSNFVDNEMSIKFICNYGSSAYAYAKENGIAISVMKPQKSSINMLKNVSGKKIKISWKKAAYANGYVLEYATNSKFTSGKKSIKVTNKNTRSKTISKLKKGKTYYCRVKAYHKNGNTTYYSSWSAVKKIKIKK